MYLTFRMPQNMCLSKQVNKFPDTLYFEIACGGQAILLAGYHAHNISFYENGGNQNG